MIQRKPTTQIFESSLGGKVVYFKSISFQKLTCRREQKPPVVFLDSAEHEENEKRILHIIEPDTSHRKQMFRALTLCVLLQRRSD